MKFIHPDKLQATLGDFPRLLHLTASHTLSAAALVIIPPFLILVTDFRFVGSETEGMQFEMS
jgi:hypothetical protein